MPFTAGGCVVAILAKYFDESELVCWQRLVQLFCIGLMRVARSENAAATGAARAACQEGLSERQAFVGKLLEIGGADMRMTHRAAVFDRHIIRNHDDEVGTRVFSLSRVYRRCADH